jgi:predicted dehydrogenase
MTSSTWRIGVIGAGWFASRRHCPDVVSHTQTQLTSLCRRDETALAKMGEAFQVDDLYTDLSRADRKWFGGCRPDLLSS